MKFVVVFLLFLSSPLYAADTLFFSSGKQKIALIELYTSEGCNSCPPADRWLSRLKADPGLWKRFIPIAFHVDYWDYIGWKDKLALTGNADRQARYEAEKLIGTIYTPGFVVNGQEWRNWFRNQSFPSFNKLSSGELQFKVQGRDLEVMYSGARQPLQFHAVILGFGLQTRVKRGENEGRVLHHDFVALSHQTLFSENNRIKMSLPENEINGPDKRAIAVWINSTDSLAPIQAAGGWLKSASNRS